MTGMVQTNAQNIWNTQKPRKMKKLSRTSSKRASFLRVHTRNSRKKARYKRLTTSRTVMATARAP